MNIKDIVKTLDEEEATRTKNVIAGTSEFVTAPLMLYTSEGFQKQTQTYVPSLFTVINEALVNCCDHAISCINKTTMQHKMNPNVVQRFVDNINIKLSKNGVIIIENDGYGIPVMMHDGVYVIIKLFTSQRTGTNTEQDKYRITGGTNGCGAKIITTFSTVTVLECQDEKNHLYVKIEADEKGKKTIGEPIITPVTDSKQFTRVSFKIDWENTKFKKFDNKVFNLFNSWLKTRCVEISLYLNQYRECSISFNSKIYKMSSVPVDAMFSAKIPMKIKNEKSLGYNNPIFGNSTIYLSVINSGKALKLSIINSIEIVENPIINDILKKLYLIVKTNVLNDAKVELTKQMFTSKINILFVGTIMNPQWVGQTKHGITRTSDLLNLYNIDYSVAKELSQVFTEQLISKQADVVQRQLKTKIENDKYNPAMNVRDNVKKAENYLWLAEGDSALALIKSILGCKSGRFNFNNSGTLSLGGVIINTYNRIKSHDTKDFKYATSQHKSMLVMDKKCLDNLFITTFIQAMGIRLDCDYTTEKDINALKYKYIVVATDQDKDGYNINGLLLVLFMKWPGLFKYGRVLRLQTPVARIKPRNLTKANISKTIEFFTEPELEEYLTTHKVPATLDIKYYKGLGGHEKEYILPLVENINKYLFTFVTSPRSEELLGIYYDKKNPDARKEELRTPVRKMVKKELQLYANQKLMISTFLQIYVKDYQLDNLSRKLLKVMDGQNNVCGKLIYACPAALKGELKVSILGSEISKKTNYHHGPASLEETIFKNSQSFPGKKLYPMLIGLGENGTRVEGGKDHSSSRYVCVKLNEKIYNGFFRKEDNILLDYLQSDGKFIEPRFYFPVLPITILENYKTTAHGWKIEIWGRDLKKVKDAMCKLLNGKVPTVELPVNPNISTNKIITLEDEDGKRLNYSRGEYKIVKRGNRIDMKITDLPIGVWPAKYVKNLIAESKEGKFYHKIIDTNIEIANYSENNNVNILVPLLPDWESKIPKVEDGFFSDIEIAFGLRVRLCDELNFISPEGGVISFERYIDFLIYWFEIRKKYYILRIDRQIEILKNRITEAKNRHKYLKNFHAWGLSKRIAKVEAHTIMSSNDLVKINTSLVIPEQFVPTEKIHSFMLITAEGQDELFDELYKQKMITGYATYEYLDSIRNDHLRNDNMAPLEAKIAELEAKLLELMKPNKWKYTWAEEIRHLVSILEETSHL
jgi:DNA topoisomerase-2